MYYYHADKKALMDPTAFTPEMWEGINKTNAEIGESMARGAKAVGRTVAKVGKGVGWVGDKAWKFGVRHPKLALGTLLIGGAGAMAAPYIQMIAPMVSTAAKVPGAALDLVRRPKNVNNFTIPEGYMLVKQSSADFGAEPISSYLTYKQLDTKLGAMTAGNWLEGYMYDKTAAPAWLSAAGRGIKGLFQKGGNGIRSFLNNRKVSNLVAKAANKEVLSEKQMALIENAIDSKKISANDAMKLMNGKLDSSRLTNIVQRAFGSTFGAPQMGELAGAATGMASGIKPWHAAAGTAAGLATLYGGYKLHEGMSGKDKPKVEVNHY